MSILVLRTLDEAARWSEQVRLDGRRLAYVPTMGFLHEGHLSLMREGLRRADVVATSIFVNPTQFGPKEDLARYPRDFEGDLAKCESAGVSMVFAPDVSQMYPEGFQTFVDVGEVSQGLCGASRPGHFRGVATVVSRFFCILRPHVALFGEKDYQQLQVVRTVSRDLALGVDVVGMPTIREADGLAMSSRNSYLSPDERQRALSLSRGLRAAQALASAGTSNVADLVGAIRREIQAAGMREDYVEIVDADTLKPLARLEAGKPARALVAGFLGQTRLIDNVAINTGAMPG
ncbi:MAG: pantoate--beta-alanine ligase [Myxococcaceae bacterium]